MDYDIEVDMMLENALDVLIKKSISNKEKTTYNPLEDYSTTELKKELKRRKAEK